MLKLGDSAEDEGISFDDLQPGDVFVTDIDEIGIKTDETEWPWLSVSGPNTCLIRSKPSNKIVRVLKPGDTLVVS